MARPKLNIDPKQVELLASCGASVEMIAAKLGCSERTLYRSFGSVINTGRETGKMNILGKQYELAMKGNTRLLIWVGKQMCGQKDHIQHEFEGVATEDLIAEAREGLMGIEAPERDTAVTNGKK